jgi:hypothetical protein
MFQAGKFGSMWIGNWDWADKAYSGFYAKQGRALMQFSLPALPAGSVITSAKLKTTLYRTTPGSWNSGYIAVNSNPTIQVHKVTEDWDEGFGNGQDWDNMYSGASFYTRKASGYGWSQGGGSFVSTPAASLTQSVSSYYWDFDIKNLVNEWYGNPALNNGLIMKYANDHIDQGGLYMNSRDIGSGQYGPYIELSYSTPPESPRILGPNYNSVVSPQIADSMYLRWKFIDTIPQITQGATDIVYLVDVSGSMYGMANSIREQIANHINRMQGAGYTWRAAIVTFSDIYNGESIDRWDFTSDPNQLLRNFDSISWKYGGDWKESLLEGLKYGNGALTLPFNANAQAHIIAITDAPFHDTVWDGDDGDGMSVYDAEDVAVEMRNRSIRCTVVGPWYRETNALCDITGGEHFDLGSNWGAIVSVPVKQTVIQTGQDEGDVQSSASVRLSKVTGNSTVPVGTYTVTGSTQYLYVGGLGLENGASYEWSVMTWDNYGLSGAYSTNARFTYRILASYPGFPTWGSLPLKKATIKKDFLLDIQTKLKNEASKYAGFETSRIDRLFTGKVVPSRNDFDELRAIFTELYRKEGLAAPAMDFVNPTFNAASIKLMRSLITNLSNSGPTLSYDGTGTSTAGAFGKPLSVVSAHNSNVDPNIRLTWAAPVFNPPGVNVDLKVSDDDDIYYYQLYYEQRYQGKTYSTNLYLTPDQVVAGQDLYVLLDQPAEGHYMYYRAYDKNGRLSNSRNVNFNLYNAGVAGNYGVRYYIVEAQQRHWYATEPNPNGYWYSIYSGADTSVTTYSPGEGSYWYRVRAVDWGGNVTDFTYSTNQTYIKY